MNHITNPHFLYLHSSIATQEQMYTYVKKCITLLEEYFQEKFDKEIIVNVVTKHDGTPLKHSYIWCKSIEVVNLLLNRTKEGVDRVEDCPDPEHDTTEDELRLFEFFLKPTPVDCSWVDLVEEEEKLKFKTIKRTIKRPMKPFVNFGCIEMTEEQKINYPDMNEIQIKFFHLKVPTKRGFSCSKLFALNVTKDVTEKQIQKLFEPYVGDQRKITLDKKQYPLVYIDRRSNPTCVSVAYHPTSFDGFFASLMNKKVVISDKCVLNFELYRQNE
jgi:hypothetical protein